MWHVFAIFDDPDGASHDASTQDKRKKGRNTPSWVDKEGGIPEVELDTEENECMNPIAQLANTSSKGSKFAKTSEGAGMPGGENVG